MHILIEAVRFAIPFWLINISLNGIYVAKLYFPIINKKDQPIDFYHKFSDGTRILGDSTTVLGVVVAIASGLLIQLFLGQYTQSWLGLGLISGLSVYFGHALGSFIKRRFRYDDGSFMLFVDHGDYIVLSGIVFALLGLASWHVVVLAIFMTYILHPIFTYISYLFKFHKYPF